MSEKKEEKEIKLRATVPAFNAQLIANLGEIALKESFSLVNNLIEAGKIDLFQGYASSIMGADLMHSAGLLSDAAYEAIFVMENIMGVIAEASSVIGSIFGAQSPFAPSLKTLIQMGAETASQEKSTGKGGVSTVRTSFNRGKGVEKEADIVEVEEESEQ